MGVNPFPLRRDPVLADLTGRTDAKALAAWASECVNRVRHLAPPEAQPLIDHALSTLAAWSRGEISMWEAHKYCWTVLKAARELEPVNKPACQVLRACSHALATCHVPTHAQGAAIYAASALAHAGQDPRPERQWQIVRLMELRSGEDGGHGEDGGKRAF